MSLVAMNCLEADTAGCRRWGSTDGARHCYSPRNCARFKC
jgi:hypothetical protein